MAAIVGANKASMHATPNAMSTAFDMTRSHKADWSPIVSYRPTGAQPFLEHDPFGKPVPAYPRHAAGNDRFQLLTGVKQEGRKMV
jgi:hypothetical protein